MFSYHCTQFSLTYNDLFVHVLNSWLPIDVMLGSDFARPYVWLRLHGEASVTMAGTAAAAGSAITGARAIHRTSWHSQE